MIFQVRALSICFVVFLVGGCIGVDPVRQEPGYRPSYGFVKPAAIPTNGAIYQEGYSLVLFADRRAARVGDIVTIRLEEQTRASKSAGTKIAKESAVTVQEPTIFGSWIKGLAENAGLSSSLDGESAFSGKAESSQSNSLSGTVSAMVAEVLPNGLLLIQGEKWLNLNRGEEYLRVSGLVRPEDIDSENSVSSLKLADARIAYSGTGDFADSNKAGWLTRFFLSPIMPF